MIGIIIVTHGKFGLELLRSAELIVGKQEEVKVFCLEHGDDIRELGDNVYKAIDELNKKSGVLVLTDLFGGSPSNVTAANMSRLKFKCLTGVNLPMLLEAVLSRNNDGIDVNYLAEMCMTSGKDGVKDIDKVLFSL